MISLLLNMRVSSTQVQHGILIRSQLMLILTAILAYRILRYQTQKKALDGPS
jgi:hypothetical protein